METTCKKKCMKPEFQNYIELYIGDTGDKGIPQKRCED